MLEQLLKVLSLDAQIEFVSQLFHIGRTEQTVITFLYHTSGHVHDTIHSKFLDSFFYEIPAFNSLFL